MVDFAYVIAGSEATGGAGVQADLRTLHQLDVYGVATLTCIVSFDPNAGWGHRLFPVPPEIIAQQFEAATSAYDFSVVKVGMLGTPATIDVVSRSLRSRSWQHVVVDPVLICKGQEAGAALDTDQALRAQILPLATVVTPNAFEAATLAGLDRPVQTVEDLEEAARRIHALGPQYVVAKGGMDIEGPDAVDVLFDGETLERFAVPKVGSDKVSGAGDSLASAIAGALAHGTSVRDAVAQAKQLVTQSIRAHVPSHAPFDTVWQGAA